MQWEKVRKPTQHLSMSCHLYHSDPYLLPPIHRSSNNLFSEVTVSYIEPKMSGDPSSLIVAVGVVGLVWMVKFIKKSSVLTRRRVSLKGRCTIAYNVSIKSGFFNTPLPPCQQWGGSNFIQKQTFISTPGPEIPC